MILKKPADARFVKCLVFAPAGAGKTVFMATAQLDERTTPMLILDFEGGTESLAGLDVDVIPISSWDDYSEAFEALANGDTVVFNKGEEDEFEVDFSKYKSVGIDSVSETHKFALLDILRKEGPSRREPDALQQQDYGKATVQMRRLLREFRDLPMHVFFVSHAKEVEIPREGRVRIPDLAGQMAEEISGLVSVQGYLAQFEEEGELHRTLLLQGVPRFRIKARTPWGVVAPEEIIDPTVSSLLDVLEIGQNSGTVIKEGSSRGKHVNDEVPVDDGDGTKIPGKEEDDLPKTPKDDAPEKVPEKDDDTPPSSDAETGSSDDPTPEPDGTPTDNDQAPQNASFDIPDNIGEMSLAELRTFAKDNDIELGVARSRGAAKAKILEAHQE